MVGSHLVHLPVSLTLGRRGAMGHGVPDMLQSTTSLTLSSVVMVGKIFRSVEKHFFE